MSLKFCNDQETDGTLDFCNEADGEISFCEEGDQLTLTGTDAPVNGSVYVAGGGLPPYSYSITPCGQITSGGVIEYVDFICCGSGIVTVTDASGDTASIDVRFALGQWTFRSSTNTAAFACYTNPDLYCEVISGTEKAIYQFGCPYTYQECPIITAPCAPSVQCTDLWPGTEVTLLTYIYYDWTC